MKFITGVKHAFEFLSSIYSLVTYCLSIIVMIVAIMDSVHNGGISKKSVIKTLSDCKLVNSGFTSTVKTVTDVHARVRLQLHQDENKLIGKR